MIQNDGVPLDVDGMPMVTSSWRPGAVVVTHSRLSVSKASFEQRLLLVCGWFKRSESSKVFVC